MPSVIKALPGHALSVQPVLKQIRAHLEAERTRLYREAAVYPTPIPRCDQQFNYLIEQRDRISGELDRIDSAAGSVAALEAFIEASAFVDDDMKRRLQAQLERVSVRKPGR